MMVFRYDYVDKKQAVVDAPATAAIEKKPEPKKATTADVYKRQLHSYLKKHTLQTGK